MSEALKCPMHGRRLRAGTPAGPLHVTFAPAILSGLDVDDLRAQAASSTDPDTLLDLASVLDNQRRPVLRSDLLRNPHSTVEVLVAALHFDGDTHAEEVSLGLNRLIATETLVALAQENARCRAVAATHHRMPEEVLEALATDESPQVRASVARNRKTPRAALARLARDTAPRVARRAIANPSCDGADLPGYDRWATHELVAEALASRVDANPAELAALAQSGIASVVARVAANASTPERELERLFLRSKSPWARDAAATNPGLSEGALLRIVSRANSTARLHALAANPNASLIVLAAIRRGLADSHGAAAAVRRAAYPRISSATGIASHNEEALAYVYDNADLSALDDGDTVALARVMFGEA